MRVYDYSRVELRTYYNAKEGHAPDLYAQDPADSTRIVVGKRAIDVILHENSHAIDQTKGAKQSAPTSKDYQPCLESSIWEIGGVDARRAICGLIFRD